MTAPESFLDGKVELHCGDCLAVLDAMPADSFDACVTDPPYHLASIVKRFGRQGSAEAKDYSGDPERPNATGAFARASRGFMGKQWDGGDIAFRPETWAKVLRVLKPGAHLVAFCAPKNFGHLQVAIEAAGFETRDAILDLIDLDPVVGDFVASLNDEQRCAFLRCVDESSFGGLLAWIFGSGFPKSINVAQEFEKRLCDRRDGAWFYPDGTPMRREAPYLHPLANQWAGHGIALKPAFEPIILARKPLVGSVAENVELYGVGALNIDACRITSDDANPSIVRRETAARTGNVPVHERSAAEAAADGKIEHRGSADAYVAARGGEALGRWPADVVHDGSEIATRGFPSEAGGGAPKEGGGGNAIATVYSGFKCGRSIVGHDDSGSAARFFYSPKAGDDDRLGSHHPTVKPLDLMQWLVRLVTPNGGTVLDLFAGTGTTGEAAFREGMRAVLIEREAEYQNDIRRRMALALGGADERRRETVKAKLRDKPLDAGPLFGGLDKVEGGGGAGFTGSSRTSTDDERPHDRPDRIEAVKP